MGEEALTDWMMGALSDPFDRQHMGVTAERIAERLALAAKARVLIEDRAVIGPARLEVAMLTISLPRTASSSVATITTS